MISTYKNFLSEEHIDYIKSLMYSDNWQYFHNSKHSDLNIFWKMSLTNDEYLNKEVFAVIQSIIDEEVEIERIYFNGHLATGSGKLHTDSNSDDGRTFLIYCNDNWNIEHGGETAFITDDGVAIVSPYPFSAVYFQNNIKHLAQPISKDFQDLRVTLAYKLKLK